jgi:hypothetical protein
VRAKISRSIPPSFVSCKKAHTPQCTPAAGFNSGLDDVRSGDVDRVFGWIPALIQVLPSNRHQAVFDEIMHAVCRLDSAGLRRLSILSAKMSRGDFDESSGMEDNS